MTDLPTLPGPDFDDVLAQLERLARTDLLVFRVEVGRTLAEDRTRSADGALKDFLAERAGPLADLGLHPQLIRQSLLGLAAHRKTRTTALASSLSAAR
jgi:hypothetical protein